MKRILFLFLAVVLCTIVVSPGLRIIFLVPLLIVFEALTRKSPFTGLAVTIGMIGILVYIQLLGRDAGVLSTILIVALYIFSFLRKQLAFEKILVLPTVCLLMVYLLGSAKLQSSDMLMYFLRHFIGLVSGLMLMHLIITFVRTEREIKIILSLVLVMIAFQAGISLLQITIQDRLAPFLTFFSPRDRILAAIYADGSYRGEGLLGDYELLSEWFAAAALMAFSLFFFKNRLLMKVGPIIMVLIFLLGILATNTRGGFIAVAVGVLFLLLLSAKAGPSVFLRMLFTLALIGGLVLVASFTVFSTSFASYFMRLSEVFATQYHAYTPSTNQLITDLPTLLNRQLWLDLPNWVTDFRLIGYSFFPLEDLGYQRVGSLHSLYLTIWFQGGLLGSLAWFWLIAVVLLLSISALRRAPSIFSTFTSMTLLAAIFAVLVNEFKIEFLRGEPTMQFFFLLLGLAIAAPNLQPDEQRSWTQDAQEVVMG